MKIKLEEVLLKEAKPPRGSGGMSSVEEIAEYYMGSGGNMKLECARHIPAMSTEPRRGMGNWATIAVWIALLSRAENDGQEVLSKLGVSPENARKFQEGFSAVTTACNNYRKQNPSTPTGQLYDQVKQLGF